MLGTFDTISTTQLPAVHPHCSIAFRLIFRDEDAGESALRIRLIDEDGKNLLPNIEARMQVSLPPDVFFYSRNLVFDLQQMTFQRAGQYSIDLLKNAEMLARIALEVVLRMEKANH